MSTPAISTTSKKSNSSKEPNSEFLDAIVPKTISIEILSGEALEVSLSIPWGIELRVLKEVESTISELSKTFPDLWTEFQLSNRENLWRLIQFLLQHAPEKISKVSSYILQKDAEWVDNNLTSDSIILLLVSFFVKKSQAWGQTISKMVNLVPQGLVK